MEQQIQKKTYRKRVSAKVLNTVKPVLSDHSKRRQNMYSRPVVALCRSKVLHCKILNLRPLPLLSYQQLF